MIPHDVLGFSRRLEAMMADNEAQSTRFFYGLQPRWLSSDRLYRIYISDRMLAGAYIAGQFYDERTSVLQLQQAYVFFHPLVRRLLVRRKEREAFYDRLDPFEPSLLDFDARNFQILCSDVVRTRFHGNHSLWTPFNVGVVNLELFNGARRRFVLVGDQEPDAVLRLMQQFDPATEVTGTLKPRPRPKAMSPTPAGKRRTPFLLLAVLLFGFGVFFGYVEWAGLAPNKPNLHTAVINVLMGCWYLFHAWRISDNQPTAEQNDRTTDET